MSDASTPSALRQLRQHLADPRVAVVMAGVAVILGLSGPFDTFASMALLPRLAYWGLVVLCTYATGFLVTGAVQPRLRQVPLAASVAGIALAVAVAVYAVLQVLNLAFAQAATSWQVHLASFGVVLLICLVIEAAARVFAVTAPSAQPAAPPAAPPAQPALLARLPLEKRGALVSISVQDHYVDVTTTRGHDLLLLRLGDAIGETAPVPGLQVHRSHWVALGQVAAARRRGDAAVLVLKSGREVPVSRSYLPAIRRAGLLPQSGARHG